MMKNFEMTNIMDGASTSTLMERCLMESGRKANIMARALSSYVSVPSMSENGKVVYFMKASAIMLMEEGILEN
jgi:hypothetical protein